MASISYFDGTGNAPYDGVERILGIRLGLSTDVTLSGALTLNTGVLYSVKGFSVEPHPAYDCGDCGISLNYLEIPVNLSFDVSNQVSLMVGTYTGFLVSATNGDINIKDGLTSIDFGIGLGAAFSVSNAVSINAGYQMGLTVNGENWPADETYNSNILIGMTYSFGELNE